MSGDNSSSESLSGLRVIGVLSIARIIRAILGFIQMLVNLESDKVMLVVWLSARAIFLRQLSAQVILLLQLFARSILDAHAVQSVPQVVDNEYARRGI